MSNTLKNKMGIYQIVNLIDGKKYVGSSKNLYKRKSSHFYNLKNNKHRNCHLQNAFNKYGEENFSFEVIEFVNTIYELLPKEQYYIDLYQVCDKTKGYNLIVDAVRHAHSEETKLKMSLARKGDKHPMYGKRGELSPFFGKSLSEETKLKISLAKKGKTRSKETKLKISLAKKGSKNHLYGKTGDLHPKSKKVICIETGIMYNSMVDAEKITGIKRENISHCCRGKSKTAGGYHWQYYNPS